MRFLSVTTLSVFASISYMNSVVAETPISKEFVGEHTWAVDAEDSAVTFTATQGGDKFQGHFGAFDIQIRLNPEDLSNAEIRAVIDVNSIDANDFNRNSTLPAKSWFDMANFPKAVFHSNDIRQTGTEAYEAAGTLTIKGISLPLILPFILYIDDDDAIASGKVKLNRTDYDIGSGEFATEEWVGYRVDVKVNIAATRNSLGS